MAPQAQAVSSSNLIYVPSTPDGVQHGVSASVMLEGFYGKAPVAQPTPSGNVATVAAGSVTGVFVNTTFSGGVGSTGYGVGDIVAALKAIGVLPL
jgi:hypothetical protein